MHDIKVCGSSRYNVTNFNIVVVWLMLCFQFITQLDVKEAPKIPVEHPQWEMSDEDDESRPEDNEEDISEFTTDEDVED